jgi:hypothetical protein
LGVPCAEAAQCASDKEAPSEPARLPIVFVRDWMYVDEVFKHIKNGAKAMPKSSRWNYDACIDAIRHAQKVDKDKFNSRPRKRSGKNNAWNWSYTESDAVMIAHAYVREFNGKISHHIFTENAVPSENGMPKNDESAIFSASPTRSIR